MKKLNTLMVMLVSLSVTAQPVADFTFTQQTNCSPDTVTFTNTSTGAVSYKWNYGDFSPVETTTSPTHIFVFQNSLSQFFLELDY